MQKNWQTTHVTPGNVYNDEIFNSVEKLAALQKDVLCDLVYLTDDLNNKKPLSQ